MARNIRARALSAGEYVRFASFSAFLLASTAGVAPLKAQVAGDQNAGTQGDENTIVVTALRRVTTVQTTPLAITAISGESLANTGSTAITDIQKLAPSLRIQDNGPGQRRISLRGILSAGEPTVGLYYDETPIAGNVGTGSDAGGRTPDFSLFDVERIEVLRGPQGTLYGASSMSGTIRVVLAKPKFDTEGAFDATVSDTKGGGIGYNLNAMVNLPAVRDLLAVRAVVYRRYNDGWIDNVRLGRTNVNTSATDGGRIMIRLTPAAGVTIDGSALIENTDAFSYTWNPDLGKYRIQNYIQLPYADRSRIYNLTGRWDAGPVTLTGITSYQHRDFTYTSGDDSFTVLTQNTAAGCARIYNNGVACTPSQTPGFVSYLNGFIPVAFQTPGNTRDWTYEFRISSAGEHWLDWTIGAFDENRRNHVDSQDLAADPASGKVPDNATVYYHRYVNDHFTQVAGFGEVSLKPFAKLTISGGARYYSYNRTIRGATDVPWVIIAAPTRAPYKVKADQNGWLFKGEADYRLTRDIMVYALASEGMRPGGANQTIGLPAELVVYRGDKLWNYELGAKTSLLDRRLTFNADIFQIDWKDMQVSGTTPNGFYSYITNVGSSRVRGGEIEVNLRASRALTLFGNMTYLDAKLTADQINNYIVAAGRSGDRLPYIPHFTADAGAEYRRALNTRLDLYGRIEANYFGASYSEFRPTNPYRVELEDYVLLNLRMGIQPPSAAWGAYVFVNNATGSTAINRASKTAFINSYAVTSAAPRTYGINVRRSF